MKTQTQLQNANLFSDVFKEYSKVAFSYLEPKTRHRNIYDVENYALPFLNKPIAKITKADLVAMIEARKQTSPSRTPRLFRMIKNVFHYGLQKDYIELNPCDKIDLEAIAKTPKTKHFKAITDETEFSFLIKCIYNNNAYESVRNALIFVLHAPLRIANLASLEWSQIDFERKLLIIPRKLMKNKNANLPDFKLPLNDEAIKILRKQESFYLKSKQFIFVSQLNNDKHIAINTLKKGINRLSDKQTIHSFIQSFRTIAEAHKMKHKASFEALEQALDHNKLSSVERAYLNQIQYQKELESIMRWWGEFIKKGYKKMKTFKDSFLELWKQHTEQNFKHFTKDE